MTPLVRRARRLSRSLRAAKQALHDGLVGAMGGHVRNAPPMSPDQNV